MRFRTLAVVAAPVLALLFFCTKDNNPATPPAGPTTVNSAAGLQAMAQDTAGAFELAVDIDCSETATWDSGRGFTPIKGFAGTLDGKGHTITGLTINRPQDRDGNGIFQTILPAGIVKNLRIVNAFVNGRFYAGCVAGINQGAIINVQTGGAVSCSVNYVGGIVGYNNSGSTMRYCSSTATVTGNFYCSGGLAGENRGLIERCFATGTVTVAVEHGGGLVGSNTYGNIRDCYATGSVTGGESVGGLAGSNQYNSSIVRCYATGSVNCATGTTYFAGGLVGLLGGTGWANEFIGASFSAGHVTGHSYVNGFAGMSSGMPISSSYWDIYRSGFATGSDRVADTLTGVNSGNTQSAYWFSKTNPPMNAWDFDSIWVEDSLGSYPLLRPCPD
jgi:hypothetical protein